MRLQNQPGVLRLGRYLYLENDYWAVHAYDFLDVMLMVPWHEELPRERRRRDKQRMKARARRIWQHLAADSVVGERQAFMKANERLADNLAHCKKRCCNRARYWEGPTLQERRWLVPQLEWRSLDESVE